jgi:hypothetical protein
VSGMTITYTDDHRWYDTDNQQWLSTCPMLSCQNVGSIATYSCATAGLAPSGDARRTCLADGNWDGAAPTTCIVRRHPSAARIDGTAERTLLPLPQSWHCVVARAPT